MEDSNGDWVKLNDEELKQLIDREARKRLRISGEVFVKCYREGTLPASPAVRYKGMLLKLGTT